MRGLFKAAGALALAAMLGACQNPAVTALQEAAPEIEGDRGLAAKAADELFGAATGPEHREVRLCMIGSGVVEVMVDRVTHGDADFAPEAAGRIVAVRGVLGDLDTSAANIWFETDIKRVTLELGQLLVESGKDRAPRLLANFAGAVNPLGLAERAGIAARQGSLAEGIVLDVRRVVADLKAGTIKPETARQACESRLDWNEGRIRAILGAAPKAAP